MDPAQYLAIKRAVKWIAKNPGHNGSTIPFDMCFVYLAQERGLVEYRTPAFNMYRFHGWYVTEEGRSLLRTSLR